MILQLDEESLCFLVFTLQQRMHYVWKPPIEVDSKNRARAFALWNRMLSASSSSSSSFDSFPNEKEYFHINKETFWKMSSPRTFWWVLEQAPCTHCCLYSFPTYESSVENNEGGLHAKLFNCLDSWQLSWRHLLAFFPLATFLACWDNQVITFQNCPSAISM